MQISLARIPSNAKSVSPQPYIVCCNNGKNTLYEVPYDSILSLLPHNNIEQLILETGCRMRTDHDGSDKHEEPSSYSSYILQRLIPVIYDTVMLTWNNGYMYAYLVSLQKHEDISKPVLTLLGMIPFKQWQYRQLWLERYADEFFASDFFASITSVTNLDLSMDVSAMDCVMQKVSAGNFAINHCVNGNMVSHQIRKLKAGTWHKQKYCLLITGNRTIIQPIPFAETIIHGNAAYVCMDCDDIVLVESEDSGVDVYCNNNVWHALPMPTYQKRQAWIDNIIAQCGVTHLPSCERCYPSLYVGDLLIDI